MGDAGFTPVTAHSRMENSLSHSRSQQDRVSRIMQIQGRENIPRNYCLSIYGMGFIRSKFWAKDRDSELHYWK
jgi:hypothetical protein